MATKAPVKKVETKKAPPKAAKSVVEPKIAAPKKTLSKLEVTAFDLSGKETGSVALIEQVFGGKVNKSLLNQALRVYSTNRQSHHGHTKTRGEVVGSTKKQGPQKGSGRARHGSVMSPVFVGGGIALGPRMRKVELDLPKKMRQAALAAALAQKQENGQIIGLLGVEKATGKTKEMAHLVAGIWGLVASQKKDENNKKENKKVGRMLIVTGEQEVKVAQGAKNLKGINVMAASQLNVFEVIAHQRLLVTNEAVSALNARFNKEAQTDVK